MWKSLGELALAGLAATLACAPAQARGEPRAGIWISPDEIRALPTTGKAYRAVMAAADEPIIAPDLADKDSTADVLVLAKALAYARTGEERYEKQVEFAIRGAMGTEKNGDVLALGRNLPGYVIAAELVGLSPELDGEFRTWLRGLLDLELAGTTLRRIHERRPNNWGTHAGGARIVRARYLGDQAEVEAVAKIFRGWLGERDSYDSFAFGDLAWQADPEHPVAINPRGAERDGHSIDGVLPDDQRRAGGFAWPPPKENYVWEALQGALLQAIVLSRAGYDCWEWGDRALLRACLWLERECDFPAEGDDTWQPWVINSVYGADLRVELPARPGKNVGWTDWTLARREAAR